MKTTPETQAHTPTPWQYWRTGIDGDAVALGPNGKYPIAKMLGGNVELNEANAAHIVHCVNSHNELVEALQRIHDIASDDLMQACHAESVSLNDFEAQLRNIRGIAISISAIALRNATQKP